MPKIFSNINWRKLSNVRFAKIDSKQVATIQRPKEGRYNFARLDFNENTTGFSDVFNCADLPEELFNTYPEYDEINAKIAAYYSVAKESVLLTNGSDEGISVISSSFIEAGEDRAIVSDPCFAIIPHSLRLAGAETRAVKVLADLSFNIDGIEAELKVVPK